MSRVRRAREALGISQAELARRAGVSRPLVAAVEAGRQSPGVDAALALAAALGATVEALFAPERAAAAEGVLGTGAAGAVVTGRVGERLVYAEAGEERWPVADAVLDAGVPRPLPGAAAPAEAVVVGCDPALGLAAALVSRRVLAVAGSSGAALEALRAGRCHGALVHGPAGGLPRARGERRVPVARWLVGLSGRRAPSLEACCASGRPVVQREPGAASQQALLRAVRALGAQPPPGPLARGHLDAARRVDLGAAQTAVTMEPAALAHGLAFTPLEEHVAELWLAPDAAGLAAVEALCEVLGSAAFRHRLAVIGGYA